MLYPAFLPLMHTTRLPVVEWSDAPAYLIGLVRFAERRNLVSSRVPSHFKRSLTNVLLLSPYSTSFPRIVLKLPYCHSATSRSANKVPTCSVTGTMLSTAFREENNSEVRLRFILYSWFRASWLYQVFIYCKYTLHVSGVHRTHHQEYIKL